MTWRAAHGWWHRLGRAAALVAVVVQVALTSLVPLADAVVADRATKGATLAVAHVHAEGAASCSPVHAEHCAFCRLLATCAELPDARARSDVDVGQPIILEHRAGARPGRTITLPRAPPVG